MAAQKIISWGVFMSAKQNVKEFLELLESAAEERHARADFPKFETWAEAEVHVQKLLALKPGDRVYFRNVKDKEFTTGWYLSDDRERAQVLYYDKFKELSLAKVPLASIWLPEMISEGVDNDTKEA